MEEIGPKTTGQGMTTEPQPTTGAYIHSNFHPQLATPIYLTFPPPPCIPSAVDHPHFIADIPEVDRGASSEPGCQQLGGRKQSGEDPNKQYSQSAADNVVEITDAFDCNLNIEGETNYAPPQMPRNESVESSTVLDYTLQPYSVVLPSGTFIHHLGGNVPPQVYQQFSPVLPNTVPVHQFQPVYPMGMRELMHPKPPPYVTANTRQVISPEQSQDVTRHTAPNTAMYATHVPEGTWTMHPGPVNPNPSTFYWSHYLHGVDKPQPVPFAPQHFLRRHSVCDEPVVTPTNVCPPCNFAGIVSATPEFIHPRKPDVPQWLMSPPVGEQDPSIISYAPMMYRNVRVPSIPGMAIPVVTPVGGPEPLKIESPTLVLSPTPYFENPPPQRPISEPPQVAAYNVEPSLGPNPAESVNPLTTASEQFTLMTPDDFMSEHLTKCEKQPCLSKFDSKLNSSEVGRRIAQDPVLDRSRVFNSSQEILSCAKPCENETTELMSPEDFDSGYTSKCEGGATTIWDEESGFPLHASESRPSSDEAKTSSLSAFTRTKFIHERSPPVVQNATKSLESAAAKLSELKSEMGSKVKPVDITSKTYLPLPNRFGPTASQSRTKFKLTPPVRRARKPCKCCKRRLNANEVIYLHLFSAALNLSATSGFMRRKHTCTKRSALIHRLLSANRSHVRCSSGACVCRLKDLNGGSFFQRIPELQAQQMSQCWQCRAEKTPDIKHPTPDVFNRWPNIPPPPEPLTEEEDCEDDAHFPPDALPLAAALFQGDAGECCQSNGSSQQDDDLQPPHTFPIGVFWDIENCAVPNGKSALSIVNRVRERFFEGHKEAEFMCVCDINKENKNVIKDLNQAQVNVVHVSATAKNAADDKLRQSIRRFAHNHPAPATLVLITGDADFTSEVSDLRHRHKYFVVLIHPANASQALIEAATTVICYEQLVADLPVINVSPKDASEPLVFQILVSNLPRDNTAVAIRHRLRRLSDNCGGKVTKLFHGTAILKFANMESANRALKRLQGEDVFGHAIDVSILHQSPRKHTMCRGNKGSNNNEDGGQYKDFGNESQPPELSKEPLVMPPSMGNHQNFKPTVNLTPGHCEPPMSGRPHFPPIAESQAMVQSVAPSFPMLHPPAPISVHTQHTSPNFIHHGYNSLPPPPQPQLFQPPSHFRKDDNHLGVKLTISNIDAQLGIKSIQDIIWKQITDHCQILDMRVRPHNRFTVVCDVTVPHVSDASRVLQHLQRQKFGTKRVLVTLTQPSSDDSGLEDAINLKRECFSVLRENRDRAMPAYRFFSVYEKRFHRKVRMEDLRLIPDVVMIHEGPSGINIFLHPKIKDEHTLESHLANYPRSGRSTPDINHDFLLPVCKLHYPAHAPRPPSVDRPGGMLKIEIGLREFSAKLHALLHSHNGILQLDGFEYCYRAEYGHFPTPQDIHEGGVMVEHQASYVPGVQIIISQPHCLGVKAIVWAQPQSDAGSDTASDTSGVSRWKSPNLIQFSREVVDLLKGRPYSCMPYDAFSSSYHRHFGRVCRVSDYGFTMMSDLLSAIPHVLQIMGSLSNRTLTLTHRAQVKRFTQEVVKILKSSPDRAILVAQMPELYNRTFNCVWRLRDYGVSVLSDLLDDIPEGHICTSGEGDNIVLSLPVRERTPEERERTNQFSREVIKILRSRPHYRMPFTEFVPTYHRQFGRQCKLANYGFSKLIDLFEALPHIVKIIEKPPEKLLALTETEQYKILSMQITSILRAQHPPSRPGMMMNNLSLDSMPKNPTDGPMLPLACIPALFQQKYNFPLIPWDLGAEDLDDLTQKLSHAIKVVINKSGDKMIRLAERKPLRLLSAQLLALLLDQKLDHLDIEQIRVMYNERYKENIAPSEYGFLSLPDIIRKALPGVIKMDLDALECTIQLTPLYKEARTIRSILLKSNGSMTIGEFNFAYRSTCGEALECRKYGFQTCEALLRALPNVLVMKGFGLKKTLTLRNHMQYGPLSGATTNEEPSTVNISSSASLDNLQSFAVPNTRSSLAPDAPPAVPQSWQNGTQSKSLVCSASMGDFKSEEEKLRKEKMNSVSTEKPSASWIPTTRPVAPEYSGPHYFQYSRPGSVEKKQRNLHQNKTSGRTPPQKDLPSCQFTVGGGTSQNSQRTPMRRGISVSVITLPNGSTPIASTSSCSSVSTPTSLRSPRTSESSECSSCSSDENCPDKCETQEGNSRSQKQTVSSLPNSPFAHITGAAAYVGSLPSVANRLSQPDNMSPRAVHLAASFPTLART